MQDGKKIAGVLLGVMGTFFWYAPWVYLDFGNSGMFGGMQMVQSGQHIGGVAYLLLFASIAISVLSWMEQHVPQMIAAGVCCLLCLLFVAQAGTKIGWGLIGLSAVSILSFLLAVLGRRKTA